eukprot:10330722-Alexandrium_andersonii.AAC.1
MQIPSPESRTHASTHNSRPCANTCVLGVPVLCWSACWYVVVSGAVAVVVVVDVAGVVAVAVVVVVVVVL